jgi:hypothetical protein
MEKDWEGKYPGLLGDFPEGALKNYEDIASLYLYHRPAIAVPLEYKSFFWI